MRLRGVAVCVHWLGMCSPQPFLTSSSPPSHSAAYRPLPPCWGAGLVGGTLLLLMPHTMAATRRGSGAALLIAAQCLCTVLLLLAICAAWVGIQLGYNAGIQAAFLGEGSCVTFGLWQCLPAGASPNGCTVQASPAGGGAATLLCPSVRRLLLIK